MTYALAIHTSSPDLGLALSNFADDCRTLTLPLGRDLSTHMHSHVMEFIQPQTWADLTWLAVAKGPGGFTGTRIGVVMARTLAQQLNIPLFGISSLAAIAWSIRAEVIGKDIAVQMAAQRGEVHAAIYSCESDQLVPRLVDAVMPEAQWQETLAEWRALRDTRKGSSYHLVEAAASLGDTAMAVLELARLEWDMGKRSDWADVLPFYGQSPV
jgi:tRNA threonylcarbamoyl adenosine modification protein YeaZ